MHHAILKAGIHSTSAIAAAGINESQRFFLDGRRAALLQRRGAIVNMTGDDKALTAAAPHISSFLSALPAEAAARADWSGCLPAINEALTVPTQVLNHTPHI